MRSIRPEAVSLSLRARRVVVAMAMLQICGSAMAEPADAAESLPVSSITLYRSGVGYFQRHGVVDGDARVQLRFKTDQINDILKSMIQLDLGGGQIEPVRYSSKEPLQKRLSGFAVDISDSPDMPKLLSRLRGAPISVLTADGTISGTVLGVEQQTVSSGGTTFSTHFVNLVTKSGIRSIRVQSIASFDILDPQLAEELDKALTALAEHRTDMTKTVELGFRGDGARDVVVAYVHEMPVWKTSYRLILPDDGAGEEPTIQGWAIVENTTDEDWKDVRLSLVAGQPIGFVMDLYEPLFIERPRVPVPVILGLGPRVYAQGHAFSDEEESALQRLYDAAPEFDIQGVLMSRGGGGQSPFQQNDEDLWEMPSTADLVSYAAAAQARGESIGEAFHYTLSDPLSLGRQQSAMVPILAAPMQGRRVSVLNEWLTEKRVMRGVELTNTTVLQLLPGPVSVHDGAAYAGDSQIGHVSIGDKRLLTYAVDLDVEAQIEHENAERVLKVSIERGVVIRSRSSDVTSTYTLENKDQARPRTIIVEHPRLEGAALVSKAKPTEVTEDVYRFEVQVEPGGQAVLQATLERQWEMTIKLIDADLNELLGFHAEGKLRKEAIDAAKHAAGMKAQVGEAEKHVAALEAEVREITSDQGRIRANMGSVDRNSDLYRRYITTLNDQETRLEQIRLELIAANAEVAARKAALVEFLSNVNVE